jgi:putative oxidoreductase
MSGAAAKVELVPVHWNAAMRYSLFDGQRDIIILIARVLLMVLFVLSGWAKLTGFDGTVGYMTSLGAPAPMLAAGIAVIMEFVVAILLILGFYTRPLAFLFALFVLGTALLGHPFWNMVDPERSANMTQFLKNLSIMGGLLLLAVSGPGRFSVDGR